MKIGMRKPSLKKSFKARTTGSLKRKVKSSINPLYGKKGMGLIRNPKKAIYNKVYRKTTFSIFDLFGGNSKNNTDKGHGLLWWVLIGWWFSILKIALYLIFIAWWKIPLDFFRNKKN